MFTIISHNTYICKFQQLKTTIFSIFKLNFSGLIYAATISGALDIGVSETPSISGA